MNVYSYMDKNESSYSSSLSMNSKRSLCLISPSLKMGGIERSLVTLADYFSLMGYRVTFISCLANDTFYKLDSRVELYEPGFKHTNGLLSKLAFYPRIVLFLRRTVKMISPDAVLVFGDLFSSIVLLSLKGLKYPVYISDRTSPNFALRPLLRILKRILYPGAAGFIAQTSIAAEYKVRQFGKRLNIAVIPNPLREVLKYPTIKREKIILYVGRLSWEKGPERLMRSFYNLTERDGWQLHYVGTGPLLESMKALASRLGIANEVIFPGKVHSIDKYYARASIYVLPSLMEGFPNSLCEAMAAGLPCVCFDTIPYMELLTHGVDGLVVRGGDVAGLSKTLNMLMDDENLRTSLGLEAQKIQIRLNVEKVGQLVDALIFG
ncbi:MAG TPA: glycosyltransferase [Bacteroidales bacterium]|nr:glycosyltransferase [Bacteroidales bacterium]